MADIDEAVELARCCLDVGGADYNECDLNTLARAVLAMAARRPAVGSRDVIRYGPATLAALIRELDEPITSAITNPAPIERGLVMDEWSAMTMQSRLRCLARNLRDAGGCALAFHLGNPEATPTRYVPGRGWFETNVWEPNLDGRAVPGWEP